MTASHLSLGGSLNVTSLFLLQTFILECHLPIANVTLNSPPSLFVAKNTHVLQMLSSDTRAMGCFLDFDWYDLSVTFAMSRFIEAYAPVLCSNYDIGEFALFGAIIGPFDLGIQENAHYEILISLKSRNKHSL